jgi:hypothetical protein
MFSFNEPKPVNLSAVSAEGLDNLIANLGKHGRKKEQAAVIREKRRRGIAKSKDYAALEWNPARVQAELAPFVEASRQVLKSGRRAFTTAGGGIFKSSDSPKRLWIDTYTAVKTADFNADFSCHIRAPGDDPVFTLSIKSDNTVEVFSYQEIGTALETWTALISSIRKMEKFHLCAA